MSSIPRYACIVNLSAPALIENELLGEENNRKRAHSSSSSSSICSGEESNSDSLDDFSDKSNEKKASSSRKRRVSIVKWCFVSLILLLSVGIFSFYVVIPWEAERRMAQIDFTISHLSISDPEDHKLQLELSATLKNTGSLYVEIHPGASVSLRSVIGGEWGTFEMPSLKIAPEHNLKGLDICWSPSVTVLDGPLFSVFIGQAIRQDEFYIMMYSLVTVSVKASSNSPAITLKNIPFKKIIRLDGMYGLPQHLLNISYFDLPKDLPNHGIALDINASIKNPTIFAMQLGIPTFEVYFQGVAFAELSSKSRGDVMDDELIFRGNTSNNLILSGRLKPVLPKDSAIIGTFMSSYLANEQPVIQVRGVQTVLASGKSSSWLNETIRVLDLNFAAPPVLPFEMIQGIEMKSISLILPQNNSKNISETLFFATIIANYSFPYNFGVIIERLRFDFYMGDEQGIFLELLASDWNICEQASVEVRSISALVSGNLIVTNRARFASFITSVMEKDTVNAHVTGLADASISTSIGNFVIEKVSAKTNISLIGMDGFRQNPPILLSFSIVGGTSSQLCVSIKVQIIHESPFSVYNIGDCQFEMYLKDEFLGSVTVRDFELLPANGTILSVDAYLNTLETEEKRSFLSSYVAGLPVTVNLQGIKKGGTEGDSNISSSLMVVEDKATEGIRDALRNLQLPVLIPGLAQTERLVQCAYFNPILSRAWQFPRVPAYFDLQNPFDVAIRITLVQNITIYGQNLQNTLLSSDAGVSSTLPVARTSSHVQENDPYIGYVDESVVEWFVPPKSPLRVQLSFYFGADYGQWLILLRKLRSGALIIRMKGSVDGSLDDFPISLDLNYDGLPIYWAS